MRVHVCFAGVAACSEGQGTGDLWNLFSPTGSHVHGHDLHQQGPAAHDRLCHPVQQEQVSEMSDRAAAHRQEHFLLYFN